LTPELPREVNPDLPPIALESGRLRAVFTVRGAGLQELSVRYPDAASSVPLLSLHPDQRPHLAVRALEGADEIEKKAWKLEEKTESSIRFSTLLQSGVRIEKKFTLDPTDYTLGMLLSLELPAAGAKGQTLSLDLFAFNGLEPDGKTPYERKYRYEQYFRGVALANQRTEEVDLAGVAKGEAALADAEKMAPGKDRDEEIRKAEKYFTILTSPKDWLGLKNRFFTVLLVPTTESANRLKEYSFRLAKAGFQSPDGLRNLLAQARTDPITVVPDHPVALSFRLYAGPVQKEALESVPGAGSLLRYGAGCLLSSLVELVGPVILSIMKLCFSFTRNYGLAIILTTIVIRLFVFPLSLKSQSSAYKMQQLSPKIAILKERYKDDQQKFGVEQMRLFRENKINPLSGCLPAFLQLPIFVAMFSVFDISIELRGAKFASWIRDLSLPDMIRGPWHPIEIPLLVTSFTIESLNLLPVLMMGITFWQASRAPKSPDPQMQAQQRMMMFMMPLLGLICYNYASGLSLYFLTNSLLALAEQKIIKQYILKIPAGTPTPPGAVTP
jgi:YidC/Oxa1 family membrane protein insertase